MSDLQKIAENLRSRIKSTGITQAALRDAVGISRQTMANVLAGDKDYKLTTLLAVVDRLGLKIVIVPKAAASGLTEESTAPIVKTKVQAALDSVGSKD